MNDLDIYEAFRSMHQSVITKIEHFGIEDWIAKTIMEHRIKIFKCNSFV